MKRKLYLLITLLFICVLCSCNINNPNVPNTEKQISTTTEIIYTIPMVHVKIFNKDTNYVIDFSKSYSYTDIEMMLVDNDFEYITSQFDNSAICIDTATENGWGFYFDEQEELKNVTIWDSSYKTELGVSPSDTVAKMKEIYGDAESIDEAMGVYFIYGKIVFFVSTRLDDPDINEKIIHTISYHRETPHYE